MTEFVDDWHAWRATREERLRDPHGWLAVTAVHWLTGTPERFDDVPGAWSCHQGAVTVVLGPAETVAVDGDVFAEGAHVLGPVDEIGLRVAFGDAVAEVASRGGDVLVRPRRPDSPPRLAYRGTPCFPPDPGWAIQARFEAYPASEVPADADEEVEVGEVVFRYGGTEHRLVAWGEDDGSLWILFRDATSGVTTYPANRQLLLPPPAPGGAVCIDFNRATNMPCAYTPFATCPVAPGANTLPFAVEAGELLPTPLSA